MGWNRQDSNARGIARLTNMRTKAIKRCTIRKGSVFLLRKNALRAADFFPLHEEWFAEDISRGSAAMRHPLAEWLCGAKCLLSADGLPLHNGYAVAAELVCGANCWVDLWTGGFPCQDASLSGKRSGIHGARTGLFFEFTRLLRECGDHKPRWLICAAPKMRRPLVERLCEAKC